MRISRRSFSGRCSHRDGPGLRDRERRVRRFIESSGGYSIPTRVGWLKGADRRRKLLRRLDMRAQGSV
jgi:hypothetical protein